MQLSLPVLWSSCVHSVCPMLAGVSETGRCLICTKAFPCVLCISSVGLNTCMNASLEKLMALKEVIFEASKFAKSPVFPC